MLVTQSCLTVCDSMDYSPLGSSVHGILQVRILEWVAMPSSGDLTDPGIEPLSLAFPAWQASSLPINSVQLSCSVVSNSLRPYEFAARHASLSITNSRSSPKFMCIKSVMLSSHLILCRPLLLLPPIPPSFRVFSNESTLRMRWPKYWNFSFSISSSNEHPGLISFRMDWLYPPKCSRAP